ncbi:MAG: helix-turn-helix domain-containing protein [Bacteroidota bacterium]
MEIDRQILFLFSALGAINGILLSLYFAFFSRQKQGSSYFLAALLMVISVRIIKSVFYFFNPDLSQLFIQVGLSACILIGPFLFLYLKSFSESEKPYQQNWYWHIAPFVVIISIAWILYPYRAHQEIWARYLVKTIYLQWFIYIIASGVQIEEVLNSFFVKRKKPDDSAIWQLSIFVGVFVIWLAYSTSRYTSYIVGALSFSFVFYLLFLLWLFRKNKFPVFVPADTKYANKKIPETEAISFGQRLKVTIIEEKLYRNTSLKLTDVANQLEVLPHYLSQFLNDNLQKSFSLYINEFRIEEAKRLLLSNDQYTIEAIGYECGFNSKSTFFTVFKKVTGVTPAQYKKESSIQNAT